MLFPFKLLPFSLPFSLWPLFGVITGIICFELNYLIHIFSLISLCFLLFVLIKKNISFGLILFICGAVLGATRIAFLKKNYSYPSFNLAQASLHVKEIIKTGNAHWPYRITLRKAAYPYHSFFLFCKQASSEEENASPDPQRKASLSPLNPLSPRTCTLSARSSLAASRAL